MNDKYKLDPKPLGTGGYAEVYGAEDQETGKRVAFKRLLQKYRDDKDPRSRMRREIEVQSEFTHPHIMPVLDHDDSFAWYTMPIAKKTLYDELTPINDDELLTPIHSSILGLLEAHKRNYLHRDISPRNILYVENHWVIADWGLVRRRGLTTLVTMPGQPLGTEGFNAPEMWTDAHSATEAADVYSLGRVIAWAITGQWPSPMDFKLNNSQSSWFNIVAMTTKNDLNERVSDMQEFLELVTRFSKGENLQLAIREEKFSRYYIKILLLMWNEGDIKGVTRDDIASISPGGYGNHSKLSLPPWDLVEGDKIRTLTQKGIQFVNKGISIPQYIVQLTHNKQWVAKEGTDYIYIDDIS